MPELEVLFCDDDPEVREALLESFRIEGLAVRAFEGAEALIAVVDPQATQVVLSDVRMPGVDGFALLARLQAIDPDIPLILLTGHGDVPLAVQALRQGAWDFIEKPADPLVLVQSLKQSLSHRATVVENRRLKAAARDLNSIEGRILGQSPATIRLRETLARIAATSVDVLLVGETGTGKEVAARVLHEFGAGRAHPFVAVNCGALAESVLESELFGHEAGAFTGASKQRVGMIEHANGGTLFLDEIESMPMAAQARLLRVLQERRVVRLGSNREIPVKLRVITAAKEDLVERSHRGQFREDLAYRLDVARIEIPPLRERAGDAEVLFRYFSKPCSGARRRAAAPGQCSRSSQPRGTLFLRARSFPHPDGSTRGAQPAIAAGQRRGRRYQSSASGQQLPRRAYGRGAWNFAQDALPQDAKAEDSDLSCRPLVAPGFGQSRSPPGGAQAGLPRPSRICAHRGT
nr:sigma-54 dependent transcriptional regulator [Devosia sp.]